MLLFCLPYAGGSESIYFKWSDYLDPSIKLYPISLKGRGKRFYEDFYRNINEAIDDIFNNIKNTLDKDDYAIYGHSMGSILAYELYYKIKEAGLREPTHIFFSGHAAPNIISKKENIHLLPDKEFIAEVLELGGTPEEVAENSELLEIFIPILRSDFKLLNDYIYNDRNDKIKCNISVLNGKEDDINMNELLGWKTLTSGHFNIYNLDGDHFFINDNIENIIKIINNTLV
ncbi:Surfactin synthase thioesterase subunit [Clostridium cavendishii DSM 21758]|uniref:Surfactin synthase thioesterase subunit n=1 Tax=Clostridium cavendishii DSM 21758 TaxID=1121302 RepID=A0A1M6FNN7_9CLOT|nr:thioesterase domain-containing protein [Clostridium cavendishii]SHI99219.1 Surfactin synthase thioesterase subunit [Clostridium cavendishii DSM 21758]